LAEGMYFEARGEPWRGQLAVGRVILNRVSSKHYPDSICDVVYQNSHLHNRCQFSFACDGKADVIRNAKAWYDVRGYAAWLLANRPNEHEVSEYRVLASLQTATHYHADYVQPHWAKHFELTARIGRHIFYSDPSA
jgi:spore germination cell wall hydrolase CwlJ-like protein